jgi:hypothetical protein
VGAVGLGLVSARRSTEFRSASALWEWERAHGDRAVSVLHNAAMAALRTRDFARVRDRLVEAATRDGELGFADDGYPYLVQAMDTEVRRTGEQAPATLAAYRKLLETLLAGGTDPVTFTLPDGRSLVIPTGTRGAHTLVASRAREMRMRLLVLDARAGREDATAASRAEVEACPRCAAVLREAVRIALALARPDDAEPLLAQLGPDEEADSDALAAVVPAQRRLLARGGVRAHARALFLGEAYGPACRLGEPALAEARGDDTGGRVSIAVACVLAGDRAAWQRIRPTLRPAAVESIEGWDFDWRADPLRRLALEGARPH